MRIFAGLVLKHPERILLKFESMYSNLKLKSESMYSNLKLKFESVYSNLIG